MAFDPEQIYGKQNELIESQIAALQPLTRPQGGVLNQIDPTWLALAQGFLAPTKTGGFGESLANAAGQLQGPLSQMRQQQMTAREKINNLRQLQMKMQLDWYKAQKGDDEDSATSLYRDLRNEDLINRRYDRLIKAQDSVLQNPGATDEAIAEAKARKEALEAERDDKLSSLGLKKPKGQAAQPQQTGDLTKDEVLKTYPDAVQENGKWVVVKDGKKYQVSR